MTPELHVMTVVGARPQFIKAAAVSRAIDAYNRANPSAPVRETIVHTGQHYDVALSDVHFEELRLAAPRHQLGVGSGSHGAQTGLMLDRLEPIVVAAKPDVVLVFGDTNSTLAGGLVPAKLGIPLAHVEAGLRSFRRDMPEEINRVVVDHLASLLFCPSEQAVANLVAEGIRGGVHLVGDVMYDVLLAQLDRARSRSRPEDFGVVSGGYVLATVHRAGNTDDPQRFAEILQALEHIADAGISVVFPAHPRSRRLLPHNFPSNSRIHLVDPLSYEQSLVLAEEARAVVTDSGGLQKEAYWLGTPCITLRAETEWPETVETGWNVLVGTDPDRVSEAVSTPPQGTGRPERYGDGSAAARIVDLLVSQQRG
jgi:UDP-N-acetylglucosamine 2-epimerase